MSGQQDEKSTMTTSETPTAGRFFQERVEQIARWRDTHGGALPSSRSIGTERTLGAWLSSLRTTARGKNGRGAALTPARRALLDELLPGWADVQPHGAPNDEVFLARVEKIAAFRNVHGHLPRSGTDECDRLGLWLSQLGSASRGKGNLAWSEYRQRVLDERLPGWNGGAVMARRGELDERFRRSAQAYADFVAAHGRRPRAATPEEKQMSGWLRRAQNAHRGVAGRTLSPERVRLLDELIPGWADAGRRG